MALPGSGTLFLAEWRTETGTPKTGPPQTDSTLEMMPTFSVIIPTYGRPAAVRECVRALREQEYPAESFEVIVVDDGSPEPVTLPDTAPESHSTEPRVRLVRQPQSGPARARNHGARLATGEFLAFTDDDCMPNPRWLATLGQRLAESPDLVVGGHSVNALPQRSCSEASQLIVSYLYESMNRNPEEARFFTSNNFALSARAFADVGGFDETFERASAEDRDLCDRLVAAGYRLVSAPDAIIQHAHPLGPLTFWRQHFAYGRGAYSFRGVDRGKSRRTFESLGFYLGLVFYPMRRAPLPRSLLLSGLAAGSQVATICGYLRERLGSGRSIHAGA